VKPKRIDTLRIHARRVTQTHEATARLAGVPLRLIRFSPVRDRTGLSRSTIWRLERHGAFPTHRRMSPNAVG